VRSSSGSKQSPGRCGEGGSDRRDPRARERRRGGSERIGPGVRKWAAREDWAGTGRRRGAAGPARGSGPRAQGIEGRGGRLRAGWAGPKGEERERKKKEEEQLLLNLNKEIEFKFKFK
jgi:hypothetical protein